MRACQVVAEWDEEAKVWVATSDDVPGLVAEAETPEQLVNRLRVMVPELLELNAHLLPKGECSHQIDIHWSKEQRVAYA